MSTVSDFPKMFKTETVVGFKDGEPVIKKIPREPHYLVEFSFPTSEMVEMESRARALLGVKHGSLPDVLGIPYSEIARKIGFGNYSSLRRRQALEEKMFPELMKAVDQEAMQETAPGTSVDKSPVKKGSKEEKSAKESAKKPVKKDKGE